MVFTRNINKALWLSFGSYPISVERWGERSTLIGYEPALTAPGTERGDQPALGATIRRNGSAQSRAGSDPMLKAYVMNSVMNFFNQSHSYWESCRFLLKERTVKFKKLFDPTVFNRKHGDIIVL